MKLNKSQIIIKDEKICKNNILFIVLMLIFCIQTQSSFSQSQNDDIYNIKGLYCNAPVMNGQVLSFAAIGGNSWIWTGPNNFYSTDQHFLFYNIDSSYNGTYTLELYDNETDSTYVFDTVISVIYVYNPSSGISLDNNYYCSNQNINAEIDPIVGGVTYTWATSLPAAIITNQGSPSVSINAGPVPFSAGQYLIIVKIFDVLGNFLEEHSILVYVIECCTDSKDVSLLYNENTSSNPVFAATTVIKGSLIVDNQFQLPNNVKIIIILPGGTISVEPFKTFTINNSFTTLIKGCDSLWEAIKLWNFSKINLTNCLIQDGTFAIETENLGNPNNSPIIYLDHNTFTENLCAMNIRSTTSLHTIKNNIFTTDPNLDLLPQTNPLVWSFWNKALTGIYMNRCSYTFINGTHNIFSNLVRGIDAAASYLTIEPDATVFDNIHTCNVPVGFSQPLSAGLYCTGMGWGSYEKFANTSWSSADFNNCDIGFYVHSTHGMIYDNFMTNMNTGVYCELNSNQILTATGNHIWCSNYGFYLRDNLTVSSFDISGNMIYLDHPLSHTNKGACIGVYEGINSPNTNYLIHDNELDLNYGGFGIELICANNLKIYENTIELQDASISPVNNAGISLSGSSENRIYCNRITGANPAFGNADNTPFGMRFTASMNNGIYFNNMDFMYTGTGFEGNCPGTGFIENQFRVHNIGLWYDYSTITGPQYMAANKWINTCLTWKAFHSEVNYFPNLYTIGTQCNSCDPRPFIWPPYWFYQINSPTPVTNSPCSESGSHYMMTQSPSFNILDSAIAIQSLSFNMYQNALRWMASRYLMKKTQDNIVITTNNILMTDFLDSVQNMSAGQFGNFDNNKTGLFTINPVSQQLISSMTMNVELVWREISKLLVPFGQVKYRYL
ncbi:MAG: hypothetical protein NTU44_07585 [Bacteroidetes bacterium]|nr:hypothetical protein [Bacteroidota bacterium]